MSRPDVLVVGGGVVGLAVAREVARGGARVTVVERGTPGAAASWAAAGMLSPQAEAAGPGPFLDLLLAARSGFPGFCSSLREESGIDPAYRGEGTLVVALRDEDEAELEARHAWQAAAGLDVERLGAAEVRALEPALSPAVRWALRFPGDHQVDNRPLARALWAAAAAAGVGFRLGADAARLIRDGDRVTGVELAYGERILAGTVVLAGGCWAGTIGGLPRPLPVEPVHGQLLAIETLPLPFRHVVDSPRCYLVPRSDGRLIVGATAERQGFRKAVTPAGVLRLLTGALEIAPMLADLPLGETWAGLRPGTPDDLPILGADPEVRNLVYATGHFRNGILLAPLTGRLIAELIRTGTSSVDLAPYAVDRFPSQMS